MNRANSGRRPPPDQNSIEAKYLTSTVGPALIRGLAEIVERRPNDPIEYLATFLYKQVENTRAQKQKEHDAKQLEIERQKEAEEKEHRAQLKREIRALREKEEKARQEREAEERRQREAEELARRHRELAAQARALPAVREEDDLLAAEFGETELHRQAAVKEVDLTKLLRDNPLLLAARNAEGKTAREVAVEAGIQENVEQLDNYCVQLLQNGKTKAINDLLICGYTEIVNQLKADEDTDEDTAEFIHTDIPQLAEKIKEFRHAVKEGNKETIEKLLHERKNLALYRDAEGSTSVHDAIENRHYNVALDLLHKFPALSNIKDIRERTGLDLLNAIDEDSVTDEQRDHYDQLKEALSSSSSSTEATTHPQAD